MQRLLFVALIALTGLNSFSQVWTGTNPSGTSTDLTVPVGASATNLSLIVNGSSSSWSYLLVKKGGAPADDTDYDFSAQLDGGTNAIHLEYPEVEPGEHLVVRVKTPAGSASHSFTVSADFNQPGLRTSSKPVTKSFPGLAYGLSKPTTNHYYRVEIKEPTYWIIGLNTTNNSPDLYVARDSVPTTASYYRRSTGSTNNLLAFSATEATPGVYYIGVLGANVSASGSYYKLRT